MPTVCGSVQRLGSEALGNSRKIELLNIANDIVYRTFRVWNYWKVIVRLIDNDYSSVLDKSGCQLGMTTRFLSNAMPEMHEIRAVYPERVIHLNFFNYWETKQFKIAC